jgi:hypothetical protein
VQLTLLGQKKTLTHIARLDDLRRYAVITLFYIEIASLLINGAITMHDKMIGKLFRRSENQSNQKF